MVGFPVPATRVFGVPLPVPREFRGGEPALLRAPAAAGRDGWRRGAVFIREIVPRLAIATMRGCCTTNRTSRGRCATRSSNPERDRRAIRLAAPRALAIAAVTARDGEPAGDRRRLGGGIHHRALLGLQPAARRRDAGIPGGASPLAHLESARNYDFDCDVAGLYGAAFVPFLAAPASSAFLVEGSPVAIRRGRPIRSVAPERI